MNITVTRSTILVVGLILALFTPVVEIAFQVLGFVLGIFFQVLGAINPLGLVFVLAVAGGLWVAYNRDLLSEWLSGDSDDEEDWLN